MLEPILVDRPTVVPFRCATCGSQTDGPFTNWHVTIKPLGMLFTCARCSREDAVRRGFVAGKKAEELRIVQDIATDAEHTVSLATKQLEKMTAERDGWKKRWEEDTAEIDNLRARIIQLEQRVRRDAAADLALVGASPDDAA